MFRTEGQLAYVEAACEFIGRALDSAYDGETSVDFDEVSDEVAAASGERPGFYYAEKMQQNRFTCAACGVWNDVLGRYAHCSACGTRNDLQELEATVERIREQINAGSGHENSVKEPVDSFESAARQYAKQLLGRIPVTDRRRASLERCHAGGGGRPPLHQHPPRGGAGRPEGARAGAEEERGLTAEVRDA